MMTVFTVMRQAWALWLLVGLVYVVVPVCDAIFGEDTFNPAPEAVKQLEQDRFYTCALYAFVVLQWAVTAWGVWMAAQPDLAWHARLGLMMNVGIVNGLGINVAHELGHKKGRMDNWMTRISLLPTCYGHTRVEHNRGHHYMVATPEDPVSARFGESFWAFLPRTLIGTLRSAWRLEAKRLSRRGKSVWSLGNEVLLAHAATLLMLTGVWLGLGTGALLFMLGQAALAIGLLELVNYVEHYGLLRRKGPDGRYERCEPEHSWNSSCVVSNLLLFHLQRHSDHHAHPARPYQVLRHFDSSPQLPTGYAGMVMLACWPRRWFAVMNPLVIAHYEGDMSRLNICPRYHRRYGVAQAS
ncbi:MAG: alkane 1-monooxygenase [Aquabacterium sp.]